MELNTYYVDQHAIGQIIIPMGDGFIYRYALFTYIDYRCTKINPNEHLVGKPLYTRVSNHTIPLWLALEICNKEYDGDEISYNEVSEILTIVYNNPDCFGFVEENNIEKRLKNKFNKRMKKNQIRGKKIVKVKRHYKKEDDCYN